MSRDTLPGLALDQWIRRTTLNWTRRCLAPKALLWGGSGKQPPSPKAVLVFLRIAFVLSVPVQWGGGGAGQGVPQGDDTGDWAWGSGRQVSPVPSQGGGRPEGHRAEEGRGRWDDAGTQVMMFLCFPAFSLPGHTSLHRNNPAALHHYHGNH